MSQLLELQDKLRDTSAAIAQMERAYASQPQSKSVAMMLRSVEKRKQQLEEEFRSLAKLIGLDACGYRFFPAEGQSAITPLCSSLVNFQSLFTVVYDAIKSGKKKVKRIPPEVQEQSSFAFGYSFSGSVGIVLTFNNEQRMLFGSALDETMATTLDLTLLRTNNDVLVKGQLLGVPAIRELHKWANSHLESHLGADIRWLKGHEVMKESVVGLAELRKLISAIDTTTDEITEDIDYIGILKGADIDQRRFHFVSSDGADMKGTFGASVSDTQTFIVGRAYKVTIRKKVRVYYSTEQEESMSHQLLHASPMHD